MGKRKFVNKILVLFVGIIILILIILSLRCCNNTTKQQSFTSTQETTNTLDFSPYESGNANNISIPGMSGINLKAGQTNQIVDFYNPSKNECLFKMELFLSDGTLIWKSDYIAPSEHISEITLLQTLQKGIYKNCKLIYNCYTVDSKTPLNKGNVLLEINSI